MKNFTPNLAIKIVLGFWLAGWFIKAVFFFPYLFREIVYFPIRHPFFPKLFSNPLTAQVAYLAPLFAFIPLLSKDLQGLKFAIFVLLLSSLTLMWHFDTYNDATFVTSFWVALWLGWVAFRLQRQDDDFRRHAGVLAKLIVGMIFLGGFVGKLTPEYWNGDVIYHIFFAQGQEGLFNDLSKVLDYSQQRFLAVGLSRGIILSELVLSFSPFLPVRWVCLGAPVVMAGITLFSTWRILSVLSCLIGMLLGCWVLIKGEKGK